MSKKGWIVISILFISGMISTTFFSFIYYQENHYSHFPWWWLVLVFIIFAIIVLFIYYLSFRAKNNFFALLQVKGFNIQKQYDWEKKIICIDFHNKKVACNFLLLHPIIPFWKIATCDIEIVEKSEQHSEVSVSLTFKEIGDDVNFFHISMFQVKVKSEDINEENNKILDEHLVQYPKLKPLILLYNDIQKVIEINVSDRNHRGEL